MAEILAFGPFQLLAARRELLAHGVPVTLGQRAFEILLMLVNRHGQLVTKDELMAEVWPGVVVEENNIQVHVSALRKVLSTAGDGERYLLTVAGRGYRFVAPVQRESGAELTAPLRHRVASAEDDQPQLLVDHRRVPHAAAAPGGLVVLLIAKFARPSRDPTSEWSCPSLWRPRFGRLRKKRPPMPGHGALPGAPVPCRSGGPKDG